MESLVSELFLLEQKAEEDTKISISLSGFCKEMISDYTPIADEK